MYKIFENKKLSIFLSHYPECQINLSYKITSDLPLICTNQPYLFVKKDDKNYKIEIPQNFYYDGATILRLLWRLIGHPLTPQFQLGAVFHDYLCKFPEIIDYDRRLSSDIFYHLLIYQKVNKIKAKIMFYAVDIFQMIMG